MNNYGTNVEPLDGEAGRIPVGRGLAPAVFVGQNMIAVGVVACRLAEKCECQSFVFSRREQAVQCSKIVYR